MYRPNFCAECGERVVRARWRVWTSRRFCGSCAGRFRKKRIVVSLLFWAALFGVGFVFGRRAGTRAPPLLVVERGGANVGPVPATAAAVGAPTRGETDANAGRAAGSGAQTRYGPDGTSGERPTDPAEVVSMCGARTQKGTPCQRRVRGTGRCWQHRGKSAMLPPSKLVVPG